MISIILGLIIGTVYGLFFVAQQRRALSLGHVSLLYYLFSSLLFSCIRCIIFAFCIIYVLRSSSIDLILVLISFSLAFWYIIRKYKSITL
ncbi:MAG TPA: hypothetical protein VLB80_00790 [Candidatus Babeliales bacterium]|nr:hypothetical protein [Candidatus Babeliales bacterium]